MNLSEQAKVLFVLPYPLMNFEIQRYHNRPQVNGVYSRDNLQKNVKDGVYVKNLYEFDKVVSH